MSRARACWQDASFASWSSLGALDISLTRVSGTLPAAFGNWSALRSLLAGRTRISAAAHELFLIPGVHLIDLSFTALAYNISACPIASRTAAIDLSGNPWGIALSDVLVRSCTHARARAAGRPGPGLTRACYVRTATHTALPQCRSCGFAKWA